MSKSLTHSLPHCSGEVKQGCDFLGTTTEASLEGDHYVLRGQKRFIAGAAEAGQIEKVYERSSGNIRDIRRFALFVIPDFGRGREDSDE